MSCSPHSSSTSCRAAVTVMPFVDMIARSKRSASLTASNSGMKPSFSMNRMAPKRCLGPRSGRRRHRVEIDGMLVRCLVVADAAEIVADLQRPERHRSCSSCGSLEMAAIVVDDIPVDALLLDVVGQEPG